MNINKNILYLLAAYFVTTIFGAVLSIVLGYVLGLPSYIEAGVKPSQSPAYKVTEPFQPLLCLIVYSFFVYRNLRGAAKESLQRETLECCPSFSFHARAPNLNSVRPFLYKGNSLEKRGAASSNLWSVISIKVRINLRAIVVSEYSLGSAIEATCASVAAFDRTSLASKAQQRQERQMI